MIFLNTVNFINIIMYYIPLYTLRYIRFLYMSITDEVRVLVLLRTE